MNITNNCVVTIHYELTNEAGDTLDTSAGGEPLKYLHGARNIIPGLESALEGKAAGDKLQVSVQPADGYGEVAEELIQVVPAEAFSGVEEVKPGMQFQAQNASGQVHNITVRAVSDEGVTIDANHPLAGQVLNFDVSVEDVREATNEEIEHGHVH